MVMYIQDPKHPEQAASDPETERWGAWGQGGPVFLPPRRLSALAQSILSNPLESDRVTAYDELWYTERPQEA